MTIRWIPELTGNIYYNSHNTKYYVGKHADDVTCKRQLYHNCIHYILAQDIEWQKIGGMYFIVSVITNYV